MRAFTPFSTLISSLIITQLWASPAAAQPAAKAPTGTAVPAPGTLPKTLERQAVAAVIQKNTPTLQRCAAKSPGLHGRVIIKLTIAPAGTVSAAELTRSTLGAVAVERCVLDAVRSWVFPHAKEKTTISSPVTIDGPPVQDKDTTKKPTLPLATPALNLATPTSQPASATPKVSPKTRHVTGVRVRTDHAQSDTQGPLPRDLGAGVELVRRGPFSLFIGGLLQVQGAFYAGNQVSREYGDPLDKAGFRIRRARLSFSGRLAKDFSYYLAMDLKDAAGLHGLGGDPGNEILDARILWDRYRWLNISAGIDRVPFSTFSLHSSARLPLIERPLATELLAPDRRVGITVMGCLGPLNWATGVYNGSEGMTSGNRFAGVAIAARVSASLFQQPRSFVPQKPQVTVSGAFMYDNQAAVDLLRAAGSLEVSGFRTKLTGEFLWSRSTPDDQPAGLIDTGEVTRWAAIGEASVFIWSEYLQLAVRYEYFQDNVDLPTFGKQQLISGGLNAYLYHHRLKLQVDYVRRDELEGPEVQNDIAFAQIQAMF